MRIFDIVNFRYSQEKSPFRRLYYCISSFGCNTSLIKPLISQYIRSHRVAYLHLKPFSKMSLQERLRELKASYNEKLIEKKEYDETRTNLLKNFVSEPGKLW